MSRYDRNIYKTLQKRSRAICVEIEMLERERDYLKRNHQDEAAIQKTERITVLNNRLDQLWDRQVELFFKIKQDKMKDPSTLLQY